MAWILIWIPQGRSWRVNLTSLYCSKMFALWSNRIISIYSKDSHKTWFVRGNKRANEKGKYLHFYDDWILNIKRKQILLYYETRRFLWTPLPAIPYFPAVAFIFSHFHQGTKRETRGRGAKERSQKIQELRKPSHNFCSNFCLLTLKCT